jgi:hypothetical protein
LHYTRQGNSYFSRHGRNIVFKVLKNHRPWLSIPKEYIPEFKYFKIAINEIPKRNPAIIRNSDATVFYKEKNTNGILKKVA